MTLISMLVIVTLQATLGFITWSLVRPRAGLFELLGMGLAIGTSASALSAAILTPIMPSHLGMWLPFLIITPWFLRHHLRSGHANWWPTIRAWLHTDMSQIVAVLFGLVIGLAALLINFRRFSYTEGAPNSGFHGDFLFFDALSQSLAKLGPWDSLFMAGSQIRYHWLSYAWAGQASLISGTPDIVTLTRWLPVVTLVATVFLAAAWTRLLTNVWWAGSLAVALIVGGGYVGATYGTVLNYDSPSQQFGTVWLLAASMALWMLTTTTCRGTSGWQRWHVPHLLTIGLLVSACWLGKVSIGATLTAAWSLVAVVALVKRQSGMRVVMASWLIVVVVSAATFLLFLSDSAGGGGLRLSTYTDKASSVQGLNPVDSQFGVLLGTLILVVAVAYRWAGLIWLMVSRETRWSPVSVFGLGFAVSALMALLMLGSGINDLWFALAASTPLAIISAFGISEAVSRPSFTRPGRRGLMWFALAATVLAGATVVLWLWTLAPGLKVELRWMAPIAGVALALVVGTVLARILSAPQERATNSLAAVLAIVVFMSAISRIMGIWSPNFGVTPEQGLSQELFSAPSATIDSIDQDLVSEWTRDDIDAADWIRDNLSDSELLATNATYSALVPAITGQPMYISGIHYQAAYGPRQLTQELLYRERRSISFVQDATFNTARALCLAGVTTFWVDLSREHADDWDGVATVEWTSNSTEILELNCDQ